MNCKKARELFLTDFTDMQLKITTRKRLQEHLDNCPGCRVFYGSFRNKAVEPFKKTERMAPPDYIWERIKEEIQTEEKTHRESVLDYLKSVLKPVFNIPKSVFATMAAAVFAIAVTTTAASFNARIQLNSYLEEQNEFLDSLDSHAAGITSSSSLGLISIMEE